MKLYAGIGARKTPFGILNAMTNIAVRLQRRGYTLRSGGAKGADTAFELGAGEKEIFTAKGGIPEYAFKIAEEAHPNWGACSAYAKRLHARNAQIILGENLDCPVEFVVCWTHHGLPEGGTGVAIRIALKYNIPVYNLGIDKDFDTLIEERLV